MNQEETIILWIAAIVAGLFIFLFIMRWVFRIDKLIKYQAGIIAILFDIAKQQGVSKERIEIIDDYIKH